MSDFSGKVALVTGTSGIGRAVALRLARAGARVTALGIDQASNDEMARDAEGLLFTVRHADVSEPNQVRDAVEAAVDADGGLDVIVNAAAVHPYGDAVATSPDTFMRCLKVNVGSVHLTAHFGVPAMRARGGGVIVNSPACRASTARPESPPTSPPRAPSTR